MECPWSHRGWSDSILKFMGLVSEAGLNNISPTETKVPPGVNVRDIEYPPPLDDRRGNLVDKKGLTRAGGYGIRACARAP
jgi:hypothetical protein